MIENKIVVIIGVLLGSILFIGLLVSIKPVINTEPTPTGYQSIELYNTHEKYVSDYKNYYKVGQNITISVGSSVPVRFEVITNYNYEGKQWFSYITRETLMYNGIVSGSPLVSMSSYWDGDSAKLYLDTGVVFKMGGGHFEVLSYNHSVIILKVTDWNPSIYDYRLGA